MATNWPAGVDAPVDPTPGATEAAGSPTDLAAEITNLNDRTVAMQVTVLPLVPYIEAGVDQPGGLASHASVNGYVYTQGVASTSWPVTHNLGRYPSVTAIVGGQEVFCDVSYQSANQLTLTFSVPVTGTAYLS